MTQLKIADVHPEWTNKLFRDEIIPTAIRDGLWTGECAFLNRNGREIPVMMVLLAHKSPSGEVERFSTVSIEITERKRAEEELQQSHEMIVKLTAQVPGVVYQYRLYPDGRSSFPFSSPGMNSIYEVTPEDVREDATPVFGRLHPDDYDRIVASIQESARTLQPFHCEFRVVLPRQGLRWRLSDALPERMEDGGTLWYGIISDITERKHAEQEIAILAEIGKMVGSTLDINQVYERVATEARKLIPYDRFLVNRKVTQDGQFVAAYVSGIGNPRRKEGDLYHSQGSATGVVMTTRKGILIQPDDAEEIRKLYPNLYETFKTGLRSTMSVPLIFMDEVIGSMNFRSEKLKAYTEKDLRLAERIGAQVASAIANAQLFTDLKKTEKLLRENNELFSLYMRHSPIYTYIKEVTPTESLVLQASDNFRQMIGIPGNEMVGKTMAELFPSKFGAKISADDWAVVSSGNIMTLDEELNGRNYTTIKFPIIQGDKTLLAGYTIDITEHKQAEKQLHDTLESLRKAVGTTIQVMVSAVETRDPYTSGHQIRSADLARAIAMEMGLPQDKIDGLRLAGTIHDIGKLSIPAEILSKPTKLSDIEFSLIKEHARKGFEMLKDVESPWPLAEIVRQHHERMDGSGYPRNLKGEEILLEARILAVADVVEAMASHRPYRPGLGIEAALNEIEKNSGIIYDKTVADACLRLFREKGFKLEGA